MPALVAGIHVLSCPTIGKDVDGRDKPGHDEQMAKADKSQLVLTSEQPPLASGRKACSPGISSTCL
jgi:hypothetical protein